MVNPVRFDSQVEQNTQSNGVEVRRIPRGVGDDRGSSPPPPKRPGLVEKGVRWCYFFLVRIFQRIFSFFSLAAPEPPAPPPSAPEPANESREDDPFEGTRVNPHSLLQYCYSVSSNAQPPLDEPALYFAYEALAEPSIKRWDYQHLGKANRWTLWEWLTCWSKEAKLARDVRAGKEYARKTPSVLVDYVRPFLEEYCKKHPQSFEQ